MKIGAYASILLGIAPRYLLGKNELWGKLTNSQKELSFWLFNFNIKYTYIN